ncbi:MAG: S24/S26 family peptidase [Myxococcales bacterium]|nr:S24/S26 family peptidase [Myxococcales bacterium]
MTTQHQAVWKILCHKLAMGVPVTYRARGQSMRPAIPDGATIGLVPWSNKGVDPCIGDVVLAWDGHRAVLHRVIGYCGSHVWIKGDRHDRIERFHTSQLLGKVDTVDGVRVDGRFGSAAAVIQVGLSVVHPLLKSIRKRWLSIGAAIPQRRRF